MDTFYRYEKCKKWIKENRKLGDSWDSLKYANHPDEEGLKKFLDEQIKVSHWPDDLTPGIWYEIVKILEEDEDQETRVRRANGAASLDDGENGDNDFSVPQGENSSWQLYRELLLHEKHFSENAVEKIEEASHGILNRLRLNTMKTGPVKGLVVGNVQSGKTANMAALMAMAADWGFNMFIILSGTIESLRKQTQNRLYSDLNRNGNLVWIELEHPKKNSRHSQQMHELHLEEDSKMRYMTVCLKNKTRLRDLIGWIENDKKQIRNLKVLVIDDEADQAGINTADVYSDEDRKTINQLILNLVHCRNVKAHSDKDNTYTGHYQAMNYISYTATPYANCLNESGRDTLYPANFIHTLDVSDSYFGPDRYFEADNSDYDRCLDVVRNIPDDDVDAVRHLQKYGSGDIPGSMEDAICWFICSAAVMRYHDYRKPVSMLIHTSQSNAAQGIIAGAVKSWLESDPGRIISSCREIYDEETARFTKKDLREHYHEYEHDDDEIWDYPGFGQIEGYIEELIREISSIRMDDEGDLSYCRGIHICIDNCSNNGINKQGMHMRLTYPDENDPGKPDFATAFIVIGGNTLSRGLTLEGLVSTFFLRDVKQMDTLMQMARWFGYRIHYELFPRIWLSEDTTDKFEQLTEVDIDLRDQICQMQDEGLGPEDFRLAIMTSPRASWLRLTSKNKMQSAREADVDFSGFQPQITTYLKNTSIQEKNIDVTEGFICSLNRQYRHRASDYSSDHIWENVPFGFIMDNFFRNGFSICQSNKKFQDMDSVTDWISRETERGNLAKWNVILCGLDPDVTPEGKVWVLPGGIRIGKINRSCKSDDGDSVFIETLANKHDYVADITRGKLDPEEWERMKGCREIGREYSYYRGEAGMGRIPLFLIYRIDRESRPERRNRLPLNMGSDIIGIALVIPGTRGKHCIRLEIRHIDNGECDIQEAEK